MNLARFNIDCNIIVCKYIVGQWSNVIHQAMTSYINECQHLAKSKNIVLSKIRGIKGSHLGWVIKVITGKSYVNSMIFINCHLARSAMNYLLYYTQYMQICHTTCFCYCISKTKNEFHENPEEFLKGQYSLTLQDVGIHWYSQSLLGELHSIIDLILAPIFWYAKAYLLYIYKYWFRMLKRWKFPPLIKAHASSTNCTMGNLTCSHHATYLHTMILQSMLNLANINRFALLTFIIPPIMGGQDSNLNFKLLSSLIIPNIEVEPSFLW
jgi:hypothetical protein